MLKRITPYIAVAIIASLATAIFQPYAHLPAIAQQGCQTFPETGKKICGRFLEYWNGMGGLMQQGYPVTDEFQEVSELDGKTYTVQYFERAIFELHPENKPPYDVLLSLLGAIKYQQRYGQQPNGCACVGGVHFDSMPTNKTYTVGDSFSEASTTVTGKDFFWISGAMASPKGQMMADTKNSSGGIGPDLRLNNINADFNFGQPLKGLTLRFGDWGGNSNLIINGVLQNFSGFSKVHGLNIGGVQVSVSIYDPRTVGNLTTPSNGRDLGVLTLTGPINSFAIGGQELWIDEVCVQK